MLLQHQANPNLANREGMTPIHLAAFRGHLDILKLLIEAGVNVNLKRNDDATPLHDAAVSG